MPRRALAVRAAMNIVLLGMNAECGCDGKIYDALDVACSLGENVAHKLPCFARQR
jgi:hypothetical protein